MNALRKLENRILEELQDVHNIQRKLAKTQLIKEEGDENAAEATFLSLAGEDEQMISPRAVPFGKLGSQKSAIKKAKSKFMKNPNLCLSPSFPTQTDADELDKENSKPDSMMMTLTNSKIKSTIKKGRRGSQEKDSKFKPTYYVFDNELDLLMKNIDCIETPAKKCHGLQTHETGIGSKSKNKQDSRRWSFADAEKNQTPSSSTGPKRSRIYEAARELPVPKSTRRKSSIDKSGNTPRKSTRGDINDSVISITPKDKSLLDSKRKDNFPEYSFRPKLTAKSLAMAEAMQESAFDRLTRVSNPATKKPTSDDLAVLQCTFQPDINNKSVEIDGNKVKGGQRSNRLYAMADRSKEKIEKLRQSEFIKKELQYKAQCSFTPKTNKFPLPVSMG